MRAWQQIGNVLCLSVSLVAISAAGTEGQERPSPPKPEVSQMDARMLADLEILRDLELLRQLDVLQKLEQVRSQPQPSDPKASKTDARGNP